jgi:hypothetical protein
MRYNSWGTAMDFQSAVRYIESLSIQGWRLGNARFEALLEQIGSPHCSIHASTLRARTAKAPRR